MLMLPPSETTYGTYELTTVAYVVCRMAMVLDGEIDA